MAITVSRVGFIPPPVSSGCDGVEIFRLLGDAATLSVVITLPSDSRIKKIKSAVIGGGTNGSHNITVSTTNAVTITFTANLPATTCDVWLFGSAG